MTSPLKKNGRCMTKTSYIHVDMKRTKALSFQIFITRYWHHRQSILQQSTDCNPSQRTDGHRIELSNYFPVLCGWRSSTPSVDHKKNIFSWKKNQWLSFFFFSQEMRCRWWEQWARSKLPPWIGHMSITQLTQVDRPSLMLRIHACVQPGGRLLIMGGESKRGDDFWAGGEHASSPQKQEFRILAGDDSHQQQRYMTDTPIFFFDLKVPCRTLFRSFHAGLLWSSFARSIIQHTVQISRKQHI